MIIFYSFIYVALVVLAGSLYIPKSLMHCSFSRREIALVGYTPRNIPCRRPIGNTTGACPIIPTPEKKELRSGFGIPLHTDIDNNTRDIYDVTSIRPVTLFFFLS
jgi:hypothetical protein